MLLLAVIAVEAVLFAVELATLLRIEDARPTGEGVNMTWTCHNFTHNGRGLEKDSTRHCRYEEWTLGAVIKKNIRAALHEQQRQPNVNCCCCRVLRSRNCLSIFVFFVFSTHKSFVKALCVNYLTRNSNFES